jgi:hypothetical protein
MENDNTYQSRAKKKFFRKTEGERTQQLSWRKRGNQPSLTGFPSGPKPRKGKH